MNNNQTVRVNNSKVYVYMNMKEKRRYAFFNELSEFETMMNNLVFAGVEEQSKGETWSEEVSEHIEALMKLMKRTTDEEAIIWVKKLMEVAHFQTEHQLEPDPLKNSREDRDERLWFMETIERLSKVPVLTEDEKTEMEYAFLILGINQYYYDFDENTGKFPDDFKMVRETN